MIKISKSNLKSVHLYDQDGAKNPHGEGIFEQQVGDKWYEVFADLGPKRKDGTRPVGSVTGAGYWQMEGTRTVGEHVEVNPSTIKIS